MRTAFALRLDRTPYTMLHWTTRIIWEGETTGMHTNRGRRVFAIAIAIATLLAMNITTALASVPLVDVNTSYDLQIDTDWQVGAGNLTIAPTGDTLLMAGLWHNGRAGAEGEWTRNSRLQYSWSSTNRDVAGHIQATSPWYDPAPSWDPSEMIVACYASAETGQQMGTAELTCRAVPDPGINWTGTTEATATVQVVGLTVETEKEEISLGESVTLSAYWSPSLQDTIEEARDYFAKNAVEPELWNGSQETWIATLLTTPAGVEIDGEEALAAATGPITIEEHTGGSFGCRATVTPTQPGTYEFTCTPSLGTVPTTMTVEVLPADQGPQIGSRTPYSDRVYVPITAETDELWQEFVVETEPGYTDGEPEYGSVYWSVLEKGEHAFFVDDNDDLLVGETFELDLAAFLEEEEDEVVIAAWVVPWDTFASPEDIAAYGAEHPEAVTEWTLVQVDAPTLEPIEGSELELSEDGSTITGLTAGVAGMNPEELVLAQFCWNAGAEMSVTTADGEALGEDESVGTGCVLHVEFPEANTDSIEATFIVTGDVVGNGTVTVTDLVRMARALSDPSALEGIYLQAADFTGSGTVTVTDLVREAGLLRAAQSA